MNYFTVIVLGSAAGGGFPQWNSNAVGCNRARAGDPYAKSRTQCSLAVTGDGGRSWYLLNASPDLRFQIEAIPALHPKEALRSSPIAGVILTNGDIDAIAGLLTLRENHSFALYATQPIHSILNANPIFAVLDQKIVPRRTLALNQTITENGLAIEAFAVPGKVPLYLENGGLEPDSGLTIGLHISSKKNNKSFFFIPSCAARTNDLVKRLRNADLVFFDGTLWRDDEMVSAGLGQKTGRRMGHMSLSGPEGTLSSFDRLDVKRKILIHINNTNPVLLEDSPEYAIARQAGWEVACDGLEISL